MFEVVFLFFSRWMHALPGRQLSLIPMLHEPLKLVSQPIQIPHHLSTSQTAFITMSKLVSATSTPSPPSSKQPTVRPALTHLSYSSTATPNPAPSSPPKPKLSKRRSSNPSLPNPPSATRPPRSPSPSPTSQEAQPPTLQPPMLQPRSKITPGGAATMQPGNTSA